MNKQWWKEAVIYQIYPRSFNDTSGDGIGDISGIIDKLDYIKSLGVDVVWLCPIYESPNDDNGYDISDYYNIMTEFGTMADFDRMLAEMKKRDLKLLMDLVANHTSDEHPWFVESRSSKDNPKRDYYIWRQGKNGDPPNNWQSYFSGNAWTHDPTTDEYYLHLFTKKQPDLNWDNKKVRQEIYDIMRFWLDKGINGFRMDVISVISKRNYNDTPYKDFWETVNKVYANGPRVHEFLKEMYENVLSHYNVMSVGEGSGIDIENAIKYVGEERKELNMVFHFDIMTMDHGPEGKFDYRKYDFVQFKKIYRKWDERLKNNGWNSIFLGNHDFPRMISRFGNDEEYWVESAKALAMLLMTMRGTPYIYQGDEIGMTNVAFPSITDYRDVETLNAYRVIEKENSNIEKMLKAIHVQGRDNARTPVHWNNEPMAGFTSGEPWINVNPNYKKINVAKQEKDPDSILNFYREMVAFRKHHPTLVYGDFSMIQEENNRVFAYLREDEENQYLVIINFSDEENTFELDDQLDMSKAVLAVSNYPEPKPSFFDLYPWQANLYELQPKR
ncbi:MAG TPA: alpha-glucosidase [Candidatus Marinimicrobia bacterium]|jgi:oligo-1,6-glucosidase|nr:MAG: glucohydrolase [Candidatus Neomarinimicrobiota bacterium]HIA90880.1 alpha-glucosidase [Candidatus Neomarinimicrobiota bacterium]HIB60779.1 alpha-glucosidase [Candidatus Neomarinimicrobiota bacterium]